jgi:hypothetical protein
MLTIHPPTKEHGRCKKVQHFYPHVSHQTLTLRKRHPDKDRLQNANCLASIGILYRNIMKNPSQVSARADLEYIRAGKAHLECHIPRIMDRASAAMVEHMLSSSQALVWNSNPCSSGTSCMASL